MTVIHRVGGATMEAGYGAGGWTRVATVELRALTDVNRPVLSVQPSDGEAISARGRGLISNTKVEVLEAADPATESGDGFQPADGEAGTANMSSASGVFCGAGIPATIPTLMLGLGALRLTRPRPWNPRS